MIWRALLVLVIGFLPRLGWAQDKVALIIGNSDYAHATALTNPRNDSQAMADKLEGLGFKVFLHQDAGGQQMRIALGQFTEAALGAEIALVFYAGHGIEMSGRNYLIPVDAEMRSEATAQFEALSLDTLITSVTQASKLGMVLLDACRDNPFAAAMQRNNGTRSLRRGLAPVSIEGQQGLLVSFAAEEGSTADDGTGMHSPYTDALLDVIDEPGLEVGRMFRKVRARVREATDGRQVPIERMQLPDEAIYFVPAVAVEPGGEDERETTPPVIPQVEEDPTVAFYDAVSSGEIEPLNEFINRYPDHPLAEDARKLVHSLQDDKFWKKTVEADTVQAYRRYLIAFRDGQYVDKAKERIAELTAPEEPVVEAPPSTQPPVTQPPVTQPPVTQPPVTQPPVNTVQPSFDCARAATNIEHAICGDQGLAQQDNLLARAYARARDRNIVTAADQRQWIKERGAICEFTGHRIAACVRQINGDRINALNFGRPTGNIAPSFSCAKASTPVERALCSSDALARQDQHLLQAYQNARARGATTATAQREWIRQRETTCAGRGSGVAVCVAEMSAERIRKLGG
ncbi:caspase family protein [Primorskyibacter aestuariivivens]|uniref:caspase family protein n=1 Tax=Primorskyibacter aestuariivivens TaxID=1888912 RepID=UPI002300116D|nr:caspase family protein [Primorskyibacter aestuariivivens]MDA7428206.1 caspase family protein [Primorskyibacter aestuariivivens]